MRIDALGRTVHGTQAICIDGKETGQFGTTPDWLGALVIFNKKPVSGDIDWKTSVFSPETPGVSEIAEGANFIRAGAMYWAANNHTGMFASDGFRSPIAAVLDVARDGSLAWAPDREQAGIYIGPTWIPDARPDPGLRIYDRDHAIWTQDGRLRTHGLPTPLHIDGETPGNPRLVRLRDAWYVLYHTDTRLIFRLCAHYMGYVVVDAPRAFHPDAVALNDHVARLVWGDLEGEFASDFRRDDLDVDTRALVDLRTPKPDVFDMRTWGFFGTREAFPRNDGGSVYDYMPYRLQDGRGGYVVVKFSNPAARTFFEEHDGAIWLRQDFTAPESTLKHGYALTNGRWFPRQWDLTPFRVEDNETLVFDASGHVAERHHFWYERRAEYVDAFDFGGDIGVQPCLKVFRDSSPFTQNPRDWECSYLTEAFGDTAWEDGHNPGVLVIWNRIGGQRIKPLPPLPIPQHHPEVPLAKRMKVSLQTLNGQYVVAEGGGGSEVNANREQRGPWEEFILTVLEDNVPDPTPPQPGPDPNPQ